MRATRRAFPALVLVLAAPSRASAGEVIVHPATLLKDGDIRDIYLGEKLWHGDVRLVPVDNLAAQEAFLAAVLQTNLRQYEARWRRKSFRDSVPPPAVKDSDAEVLAFVRSTPGAVGYLKGKADASVVVVSRF